MVFRNITEDGIYCTARLVYARNQLYLEPSGFQPWQAKDIRSRPREVGLMDAHELESRIFLTLQDSKALQVVCPLERQATHVREGTQQSTAPFGLYLDDIGPYPCLVPRKDGIQGGT